jgi:hypothetical protein
MHQTANDTWTALLRGAVWRKSSHSNPNGDCVEFAGLTRRLIAVRNSRHPDGPTLILDRAALDTFIVHAQEGKSYPSDNDLIRSPRGHRPEAGRVMHRPDNVLFDTHRLTRIGVPPTASIGAAAFAIAGSGRLC